MPILLIALLALLVFGGIGVLLVTAMIVESRKTKRQQGAVVNPTAAPGRKRAA